MSPEIIIMIIIILLNAASVYMSLRAERRADEVWESVQKLLSKETNR